MVKYGLYEADETPRRCKCGRTVSRVVDTWETVDGIRRRKRLCICGKQFLTQTPIENERFINKEETDERFIRG